VTDINPPRTTLPCASFPSATDIDIMATANGVKDEDFSIKMDPDVASPSLADIDEYEDTGELVIPKKVVSGFTSGDVPPEIPGGWLLRIPKELWQGLANLPLDEEIQIGHVKAWGGLNKVPSLMFDANIYGLVLTVFSTVPL
jgi:hypothetical protein